MEDIPHVASSVTGESSTDEEYELAPMRHRNRLGNHLDTDTRRPRPRRSEEAGNQGRRNRGLPDSHARDGIRFRSA